MLYRWKTSTAYRSNIRLFSLLRIILLMKFTREYEPDVEKQARLKEVPGDEYQQK
jgi:hypothetical protein